jgi:Protein kinase domain/FHA domain
MPSLLRVTAGPDEGKCLLIPATGVLTLGRAADVEGPLGDTSVSRYHCRVISKLGKITVLDLGSKAGTTVNNQRISTQQPLRPGDFIVIGLTHLQFITDSTADTTDMVPALKLPASAEPAIASKPRPAFNPRGLAAGPTAAPNAAGLASGVDGLASFANTGFGTFAIGPILANGVTGIVFRAVDTSSRTPVALKIFVARFSRDDESVERFIRAARTVAPLRYLHLVDVYNAGRQDGHCWTSMELIEGFSVAWVVQQAALKLADWHMGQCILRDVTRALVFLHGKGILHRNLTPENLLMDSRDGLVKVADLISAKAQEGNLAEDVTAEGHLISDVRFLPPECAHGNRWAGDERSDLYSLGAVVYAVLTGRPPLEGKTQIEALEKIQRLAPLPVRRINPAVAPPLEAVVMRLLTKNPRDRFASAKELLRHLVEHQLTG